MDNMDRPLESFTQETLQKVLKLGSNIRSNLEEVERKIETTQERILATTTEITKIEGLHRDIELTRRERQKMLAAGVDHQEITARIKGLQEELQAGQPDLELLQDERAGLEQALEKFQKDRLQVLRELEEMDLKVKLVRHMVVVNEYNEQAAKFSGVVARYWETRDVLPKKFNDLAWGKGIPSAAHGIHNTALWRIPILRQEWVKNSGQQVFHFTKWKDLPETY